MHACTLAHIHALSQNCPYCVKAKELFEQIECPYEYKDLAEFDNPAAHATALLKLTGRNTVPNIFIGGENVGGFDELSKLHTKNELVQLLQQAGAIGPARLEAERVSPKLASSTVIVQKDCNTATHDDASCVPETPEQKTPFLQDAS